MTSETSKWQWMGYAGAAVLGLVFLLAAVPKALDPLAFAEQIRAEGLAFGLPSRVWAWAVIVLEAGLGAALVLGLRRRAVLIPTGLLVALFVFLTARTYLRWLAGDLEDGASCGCFGNLIDRTPAEAFWQDLALLVPPFLLAAFAGKGFGVEGKRWRWMVVGAFTAAVAVLAWAAPRLPLDDAATRLGVGERIDSFCAGAGKPGAESACLDLLVPQLLEGRHLVVIDDLDSATIEGTVERLNQSVTGSAETSVWLLTDAQQERLTTFFWEWGPLFEVREVPLPLLRPLYRTLPRSFLVEDGTVVRTWAGLPNGDT